MSNRSWDGVAIVGAFLFFGTLTVIYILVGLAFAYVYGFLAGGTELRGEGAGSFDNLVFYGPFFLFLYLLTAAAYDTRNRGLKKFSWPFWLVTAWFFAPVIMRVLSEIAPAAGYTEAGEILFELRYSAFVLAPVAIVAIVAGTAIAINGWKWLRKKYLPENLRPI